MNQNEVNFEGYLEGYSIGMRAAEVADKYCRNTLAKNLHPEEYTGI
jgi:hypothetical protein